MAASDLFVDDGDFSVFGGSYYSGRRCGNDDAAHALPACGGTPLVVVLVQNLSRQFLHRHVRRPAAGHAVPAQGLRLRGLLPRLPPLLLRPAHQAPDRALQLRRLDEVAALPVHLHGDGDAHDGHELERVQVLLRELRPGHHRYAVPQALEDGVPAAVGDEAADGGVGEDVLLRRPRGPHEASALRPLQEPFREQLVD
uniref:Uncharacterized protein n=1 Tax=Zea mays TaxID=4577 RepID=A0A804QXH9_MAIZE